MYPDPQTAHVHNWTLLLHRNQRHSEVFHQKRYDILDAGKIKGSLVYFGGFVLIILNFGLFGSLAQIAGFILIFRTFLPDLYDYICKTPVIGSYLSRNGLTKKAIGSKML